MKNSETKTRIFIIESQNPIDLLQGRSESEGLERICKLIGHEVATFHVRSRIELEETISYIATISNNQEPEETKNLPLCIHFSAHGNETGLAFGKDFIGWKKLFRVIQPLCCEMEEYQGEVIFVISACGAGKQKLSTEFKKEYANNNNLKPPKYIFVTVDENVYWDDAMVSWAMFYHQLPKALLKHWFKVRSILKRIKDSRVGNLQYHRWDDKRKEYLVFRPE